MLSEIETEIDVCSSTHEKTTMNVQVEGTIVETYHCDGIMTLVYSVFVMVSRKN